MTVGQVEVSVEPVLPMLWQRHRQASLDRISLIEVTTANAIRSIVDREAIAAAAGAAHKLAGSLGIFGFDAGSRAALEVEYLLREPELNVELLAEAVIALRSSVREEPLATLKAVDGATSGSAPADFCASVLVISTDVELISRLTVEAAAVGLSVVSSPRTSTLNIAATGRSAVIFDESLPGSWTRTDLLASIAAASNETAVVVLTEHDTFEDRAPYARAGASGIVARAQGPAQMISFLMESVRRKQSAPCVVLALNLNDVLEDVLERAFADFDVQLDVRSSGEELWDALEEQGADMVVVGYSGSELSGPDLCRVIRAHPHWHRLPVVIMGRRVRNQLDESFAAGANDYLSVGMSSHDLGVRLHHLACTWKLSEARGDTDPVAGTCNRSASEESLDRQFRTARNNGEPFALALVAIDHLEQIRATEGTAVGNAVLRRLGTRLLASFQGGDFVGRWAEDTFAVGLTGSSGVHASERIGDVLAALTSEGVATTSGEVVHYTFSAGIASAPVDGLNLASLKRTSETALGRASHPEHGIVVSGARPGQQRSDVVDVVLVDDDDAIADVIEHALELRRYSYLRFSDGAEAATALSQGGVAAKVILLDVGLPSLDGFGVLHVLRSEGVTDETRVIMLTARSSEGETLRAIGLGATEHITKPFSIPVLLARLDQMQAGAGA
jgi:diguanylate cyclase (GGDEF)-like protein